MAAFQGRLFAMAAEVRKAGMAGDPRPFSAFLAGVAAGGGRGGVVTSLGVEVRVGVDGGVGKGGPRPFHWH